MGMEPDQPKPVREFAPPGTYQRRSWFTRQGLIIAIVTLLALALVCLLHVGGFQRGPQKERSIPSFSP